MGNNISTTLGFSKDLLYFIDTLNKYSIKKCKKLYLTKFKYIIYYYTKNKILCKIENNGSLIITKKISNDDLFDENLDFLKHNSNLNSFGYDFKTINNEKIIFAYKISKHINCCILFSEPEILSSNYDITPNITYSLSNNQLLIGILSVKLKIFK